MKNLTNCIMTAALLAAASCASLTRGDDVQVQPDAGVAAPLDAISTPTQDASIPCDAPPCCDGGGSGSGCCCPCAGW